jgi:hypothetical protein
MGYSDIVRRRISKPYLAFTIGALKQECGVNKNWKAARTSVKKIIDDAVFQSVLIQNKKDRVSVTRKILFWAARNKLYFICYLLLKAKQ